LRPQGVPHESEREELLNAAARACIDSDMAPFGLNEAEI